VKTRRTGSAGGIGEDELELLTGFVGWLARQDIPESRRTAYHTDVERYLVWRAGSGTPSPTATGFTLTVARRTEAVRQVRAAFALLRRYLVAASFQRVDSPNPLWSRLRIELTE
jgi:hypothetical protein